MDKKSVGLVVLIIIFSVFIGYFLFRLTNQRNVTTSPTKLSGPQLTVGNCTFNLELANTDALKQQGLSDREKLADNSGMLFIYNTSQVYGFWMIKMKFALDFVWIKDDLVVDLHENVPYPTSQSNIARVYPKEPVNKVLEINNGKIKECEIKIGEQVKIIL